MKTNNRRGYFIFSAIVFVIVLVCWVGFQVYIFLLNKSVEDKDTLIAQQKIELENYKTLTGFNKLMAVKELE
jgi:cell division protein FtsL